ncbi:uncharacterized protein hyls1 isoform X1 [Chaetodon trifascialis]|uniref:uncharacterized protein hyls1 isoform X1 n=1 Tax=Chaetodon trifascialis TaxID=109706 RepID=UPI003992D507
MSKMYDSQWDDESDDDKKSLNSSFWSDGERREEEEEEEVVEIERVVQEEDSKTIDEAKGSLQEALEEEKPELNNQGNLSEGSFQSGSNNEEEDDDDESCSSSCDSQEEEEEEEVVEIERVVQKEDSKHVDEAEGSLQEDSEEEKPELNNQSNTSEGSFQSGSNDDEEEEEEEDGDDDDDDESCSSSCDSPAPSLMTSGYGTYRPEEQEGGDYRDDHTITEFDQDSRGDLSETRDDEEDSRSLCSFGGFDIEPAEPDYSEPRPVSALADTEPEANVAFCGDDGLQAGVDDTDRTPEEDPDRAGEEKSEEAAENKVRNGAAEEHRVAVEVKDKFVLDEKQSVDVEEGQQSERLEEEEEVQDLQEDNDVEKEDKVQSEDPDVSSSNKDIKFIDSKVDFSQMTYEEMCEEWEGNLRQMKEAASCLEERLAELRLSTSPQRDFETENEDEVSHSDSQGDSQDDSQGDSQGDSQSDSQSSESEGISMSAFESYIRGLTRAQRDADIRPKPKSFIRPVLSQQTMKKTDPVAKYFQYKQLWDMYKLPGETDRRGLRLEIKERLAYQPPPPKPRRVYVPNTYIVPTEKKRSALRWEIRNDLANSLVPYKCSYRF